MIRSALPIDPLIPEIIQRVKSGSLVLVASPGCGKSTRVPPAILDSLPDGQVLVLVPRRLAAKTLARRVAAERNEEAGQSIGYHFRFEKKVGPSTRLIFLTEGMLLRYMLRDPSLRNVSCVVLDEFHERHLHTDVALGLLKSLKDKRPELKLLVMSATMDAEKIATYLSAPTIKVDMPQFPVEIVYNPLENLTVESKIENVIERSVTTRQSSSGKNTLVFLPGIALIRKTEERLKKFSDRFDILTLYGDLSKEEQNRVFDEAEKPKIILSTNIAESALTLPNIGTVIDSGLHRQAGFSWWSGIPSLTTRPISQASAIQRAGRAGRTGPGKTIRLYSEHDFKTRASYDPPEIQRADLSQVLLEMKRIGANITDFPWFEPPAGGRLSSAGQLLFRLGALSLNNLSSDLTEYGNQMAEIPLHPRLSRLVLEGRDRGCGPLTEKLAEKISEGQLDEGNVLLSSPHLSKLVPIAEQSVSVAAKLLIHSGDPDSVQSKSHNGFPPSISARGGNDALPLIHSLFAAYPDQVAQVIGSDRRDLEVRFCHGGSALMSAEDLKMGDTLLVLDVRETAVQGKKGRTRVFNYCPLPQEILWDCKSDLLVEKTELSWNKKLERIEEKTLLSYGELILFEETAPCRHPNLALDFLLKMIGVESDLKKPDFSWSDFLHKLVHWTDPVSFEEALARYFLFCEFQPDKILQSAETLIRKCFAGIYNLKDLSNRDWNLAFQEILPAELSYQFNVELPLTIHLPHRKNVKIQYRIGHKPWIESKLQDFVGLQKTPAILGGKLLLNLHLLAPNKRPVQVTQDLDSFWKKTYPELRPALSRRYPRHHWP